jgi:uncharacterized protein YjdB
MLGAQVALKAEVHNPSGDVVSGVTVFWSSLDTTIATVSSAGVVTGKSVGTTSVAASSGGQSDVVPVEVVPVPTASIAVLPTSASVAIGASVKLQAVVYDADHEPLSGRSIVWATSAPQTATVATDGTVTGITAGTATISATSGGKSANAVVTVTLIPVAAVTVTPGSASLVAGAATPLAAAVTDANGNVLSGRAVAWTSANTSIATVSDQGLVTGVAAGTTTVTATSEGKTGVAQIVVTAPPPAPVASVSIDPATSDVGIGATVQLQATLSDSNGAPLDGRAVTWETSNPRVASVSSAGVVTALDSGVTTITATSEGKSGTATVTVDPPAPPPASVASVVVSPATFTLRNHQSRTVTARAYDADGKELSNRTFTWSSSDSTSVSVTAGKGSSATVQVQVFSIGSATITATCEGVAGTATVTFLL